MPKEDAEVRARLGRGEEDTLVSLLRFGVAFTKEYPIAAARLPPPVKLTFRVPIPDLTRKSGLISGPFCTRK